jgi:hypothetical protein
MERYELQPSKSMILPFHPKLPIEILQEIKPWQLGNNAVDVVSIATHLGMQIDSATGGVVGTIEMNMSKARKALYSMMGAGLHGKNGMSPRIALKSYSTYILPILTYGLEVLLPDKTALQPAIKLHRKLLLQLCSLADNVATPTPYILAGMLPLDAVIHKKALNLFRAMVIRKDSVERKLIERQLSLH